MDKTPTTIVLADALVRRNLGYPLEDWLKDQIERGRSWRRIAEEFTETFELDRPLSRRTLERWAQDHFGMERAA